MNSAYDIEGPYTHQLHSKRCGDEAIRGALLKRPMVQARVAGVSLCAELDSPWNLPGGRQMWKLRGVFPLTDVLHVPVDRVRLCGGIDDKCLCDHDRSGRVCATQERGHGPEGLTC
jgi:hypothetical protein